MNAPATVNEQHALLVSPTGVAPGAHSLSLSRLGTGWYPGGSRVFFLARSGQTDGPPFRLERWCVCVCVLADACECCLGLKHNSRCGVCDGWRPEAFGEAQGTVRARVCVCGTRTGCVCVRVCSSERATCTKGVLRAGCHQCPLH